MSHRASLAPRIVAAVVVVLGVFTVLPAAISRAAVAEVTISTTLSPKTITITAGSAVTWRNVDSERHRPRSTSGPDDFDAGNLEPGETGSVILSVPGTYAYVDHENESDAAYHGSVVVTAVSPSTTTPPTTTPPGGGGGGGGGTPPPQAATVSIVNSTFSPAALTLPLGSTVTWRNDDDRSHTATSSTGAFASGTLGTGATFAKTFGSAGTFPYFCEFHPDMQGTIAITTAGGGTPPPPPPPTTVAPPPPVPPAGPPVGAPGAAAGPVNRGVAIVDFGYTPSSLSATVGDTITFVNTGRASHSATSVDGSIDSGVLSAGGSYRVTLRTPGTIPYSCLLHPAMRGSIAVSATPGVAAPAAAPGTPTTPTTTSAATKAPGRQRAAPSSASVDVEDFAFAPATTTVAVGGTVTWTSTGKAPHTVTADGDTFDSGLLDPGDTFEHTFAEAGTFTYLCSVHPAMTGSIEVVAAAASDAGLAPSRRDGGGAGTGGSVAAGLLVALGVLVATGILYWRVMGTAASPPPSPVG